MTLQTDRLRPIPYQISCERHNGKIAPWDWEQLGKNDAPMPRKTMPPAHGDPDVQLETLGVGWNKVDPTDRPVVLHLYSINSVAIAIH